MRFLCSSRRRHTRWPRDWSSDVCSSDLLGLFGGGLAAGGGVGAGLLAAARAGDGGGDAVLREDPAQARLGQGHRPVQRSEERRVGEESGSPAPAAAYIDQHVPVIRSRAL